MPVTDTRFNWAVLTLSLLVTHPAVVSDSDWQQSIIQFMFAAAFFDMKKPTSVAAHVCNSDYCTAFFFFFFER
jgi:hypothetical protein